MNLLSGERRLQLPISWYLQGCQTYRTRCLWERFFLLFDVILIGQISGHFILTKRLDVKLKGRFRAKK